MKLFSVQEAEKIVVCTLEKDKKGLLAMYKRKNLLRSVMFSGIAIFTEVFMSTAFEQVMAKVKQRL